MMAAMGRKAGDMTLDKWQRMTEWFMTALALVFLFAYSWEVLARTHILLCEMVINIIWMAFIVDYVVSILLAEDKKTWFKGNLLMLVSIALPVFRPLRLLRLVAVLNVLNRTGGMAVRGRITLYTCCSVTLLMYIGALAELDVERGVPGASITDFGEAIWWVVRDRHHSRLWRFVSGDMAGKKHRHRADDNRRGPDRHRHRDTGLMDSRSCP